MLPRIAEVSWKGIGWVLGLVICNPISVFGMNAVQFVAAPGWLRYPLIGLFGLGLAAYYGWFVLCLYLPIRLIREVFGDRDRAVLWSTAAAALFLYGTSPLGFALYRGLRDSGLERVRQQAQPLIEALETYKETTGGYPAELSDLTPKFLPALPDTGSLIFPDFHYLRATDKTLFRSYELSVATPEALNSFDRYLFWPERKYPEMYGRNGLEPIGDWAFMHE